MMSHSTGTKRACDACHRRKVRCNNSNPCENCTQAGLTCSYNAIPQKKGPKGSRAKVISELRETQKHSMLAKAISTQLQGLGSPPVSPTFLRTPGLLAPEMIDACIQAFLTYLYPTMPILHKEQLNNVVADMSCSKEAYCLIASLSAFVLIQPGIMLRTYNELNGQSGSLTNVNLGMALLDEALRIRKCYDYFETPTVMSVITSFFLFGCFFGLNKHNTAWFHLREATASIQLLGMQDESNYLGRDVTETCIKRRLFWLLFITERAYALQRHRPLTLNASIELPKIEDDPSISVAGFIYLVNLYLPFDEKFVGLWNKSNPNCSTNWLAQLQKRLSKALPTYLNVTESQAADLKTSQHWLRTMVWQLSITSGYLSSTSSDSAMTFQYPVEIAKDLVTITGGFSQQSMEIHGIGLVEKVFDVACTLIDVMCCVPMESRTFELGPQDYLNQLLMLISTLRGGESRFLPLLAARIEDSLPGLVKPVTQPLLLKPAADQLEEVKQESASSSSGSGPYPTPPYTNLYHPT